MYWRMCYNVKRAKCRKDRKIMAVIYENKVKELGYYDDERRRLHYYFWRQRSGRT